jgi:Mycobacterium membrane protein
MDLRLDLFAETTADGPAGGDRVRTISISGLLRRWWIPLLLVVVLAVSGLVVSRLHKVFGSQDLNANAGAGIKIVQFNPKVVKYEVDGPPGSVANINYWDADANTHQINGAPLPWSYTISTTLPAVSANIMAQTDGNHIGCRITVDGVLREHQSADGINAQTYCLVKSA